MESVEDTEYGGTEGLSIRGQRCQAIVVLIIIVIPHTKSRTRRLFPNESKPAQILALKPALDEAGAAARQIWQIM